eukprot:218522-Chlamydomonas_euryale.AAC.4
MMYNCEHAPSHACMQLWQPDLPCQGASQAPAAHDDWHVCMQTVAVKDAPRRSSASNAVNDDSTPA